MLPLEDFPFDGDLAQVQAIAQQLEQVLLIDDAAVVELSGLGLPGFCGVPFDLSPQVGTFLQIMEDTDGGAAYKRHIADELGLEPGATFRTADVFKRHKQVYTTVVDKDEKGHYLLKSEFVILERG